MARPTTVLLPAVRLGVTLVMPRKEKGEARRAPLRARYAAWRARDPVWQAWCVEQAALRQARAQRMAEQAVVKAQRRANRAAERERRAAEKKSQRKNERARLNEIERKYDYPFPLFPRQKKPQTQTELPIETPKPFIGDITTLIG